jgi:hypothetical protein
VSAYVVDNLDMARIKPIVDVAIARFESHQAVKPGTGGGDPKLSERKVVEKAKGILMKTRGLSEDAAYAALRKLAMERAQPMAKVAGDLVAMARLSALIGAWESPALLRCSKRSPERSAAWAAGSDAPEKKEVRIGFIPLTDCSSVVMAAVRNSTRSTASRSSRPRKPPGPACATSW